MFIDASALTALMMVEPGSEDLHSKVERADRRITSPIAIWETVLAVARITGISLVSAERATMEYLDLADIELASIEPEVAALAIGAFDRFGKGRHPARLNMGDCFAYACARHNRQPLLFVGGDFTQTDIEPA